MLGVYKQTDKNPALMKHIIYDRREKVKKINVRYMVHPMVMRIVEKDRNKKGWGGPKTEWGGIFNRLVRESLTKKVEIRQRLEEVRK